MFTEPGGGTTDEGCEARRPNVGLDAMGAASLSPRELSFLNHPLDFFSGNRSFVGVLVPFGNGCLPGSGEDGTEGTPSCVWKLVVVVSTVDAVDCAVRGLRVDGDDGRGGSDARSAALESVPLRRSAPCTVPLRSRSDGVVRRVWKKPPIE